MRNLVPSRVRGKLSIFKVELEEKLNTYQSNLVPYLEENSQLVMDLCKIIRVKPIPQIDRLIQDTLQLRK